mgnify:CR=1 FL=1
MGFARKDVEATKKMEKKFVRYPEGAEKYSLGWHFGVPASVSETLWH